MIKVLLLCNKAYWTGKLARERFHAWDAISRQPEIEAVKDGPGFPDWVDAQVSVEKNKPDVVFWYKPKKIEGYKLLDPNLPKVLAYNEMYLIDETKDEIISSKTNIILCHLENDMKHFKDIYEGRYFVHMPHCIEKTVFKDWQLPKTVDILFTGVVSPEIYPLRSKLRTMITSGKFSKFKTKILPHPGYEIKDVDGQILNYAKELNQSKVVITCCSKYKYALTKYIEATACNSLLIGDFPDERFEFFKQFIVEINISMSEKRIIEIIDYWINNVQEREEKNLLGMKLISENNTYEHYTDRFVKIVKESGFLK